MRCSGCGEECHMVTVDFGIGAYEYWGATGWDSQIADVSNCCETDILDDDLQEPDEYICGYDMELA